MSHERKPRAQHEAAAAESQVDPIHGFGEMWCQRLKVYGVAELTWEFEHRVRTQEEHGTDLQDIKLLDIIIVKYFQDIKLLHSAAFRFCCQLAFSNLEI